MTIAVGGAAGQQNAPTNNGQVFVLRVRLVTKKDSIDYEKLVQSALRVVVRDALSIVAKHGLTGKQHFYIALATDHPGVDLPDYLKDEYPDEITIVLQHEFWDLVVEDKRFSITLCFNDINERLTIPFEAITSFVDPSAKFGLQFTPDFSTEEDAVSLSGENTTGRQALQMEEDEKPAPVMDGSNIVTLDTFRKK
ncbi:MAG: ClpXP protease specificity-enhancing factor SspB [Alphaproteobacteria bacterium]|nr:ClpXP protease specificity-enhancing factor SspB [Alphaproteobacteria bacterium]